MKHILLLKTALFTLALLFTASFASAKEAKKKYVYEGDEDARSICMAIAKNQKNRLRRSLARACSH